MKKWYKNFVKMDIFINCYNCWLSAVFSVDDYLDKKNGIN